MEGGEIGRQLALEEGCLPANLVVGQDIGLDEARCRRRLSWNEDVGASGLVTLRNARIKNVVVRYFVTRVDLIGVSALGVRIWCSGDIPDQQSLTGLHQLLTIGAVAAAEQHIELR